MAAKLQGGKGAKEYTLHRGDCLEVLPTLAANSIDAVITDLPYGTTDCSWDSIINLQDLWHEYRRIVAVNGVIVLFAQKPFIFALGMQGIDLYRHSWVWKKDKALNWMSAPYQPMKTVEDILVFSPSGFAHNSSPKATYNPQMVNGEHYDAARKVGAKRIGNSASKVRSRPDTSWKAWDKTVSIHSGTLRYPTNVVTFPVVYGAEREHPTQKPTALLRYLVRTYTNPGDIVLDSCMGSGTTGVACMMEGRRFVGVELDAEYYEIARRRIDDAARQLRLNLDPLPLWADGVLEEVGA